MWGEEERIIATATDWCDVSKLRSPQNAVTIIGFRFPVERISLLAPPEKWKTEFHYRGADDCGRQASNWIGPAIGWTVNVDVSLTVRCPIDYWCDVRPPRFNRPDQYSRSLACWSKYALTAIWRFSDCIRVSLAGDIGFMAQRHWDVLIDWLIKIKTYPMVKLSRTKAQNEIPLLILFLFGYFHVKLLWTRLFARKLAER